MPLNITVAINGRPLREYHIGRMEGGTDQDDLNEYSIVEIAEPGHMTQIHRLKYEDFKAAPKFKHRYGDGVDTCVLKGIEAILKSGGSQSTR